MIYLFFLLFLLAAVVCLGVMLARGLMKRSNQKLKWVTLALLAVSFVLFCVATGDSGFVVIMLSLLLLGVALVEFVLGAIRRITKRNKKKEWLVSAVSFALFFVLFVIQADMGISNAMLLGGVLGAGIFVILLVLLPVRLLMKKPLRPYPVYLAVTLAAVIGLFAGSEHIADIEREKAMETGEIEEIEIQIDYDFEVVDGDEPIEIVEYTQSGFENEEYRYIHVYDAAHLDLLFDHGAVTAEDCKELIRSNDGIPERIKDHFCDFVDRIAACYPDVPLDTLYHNLQTLTVQELSRSEYLMKSLSYTSLGVYRKDENAIYIPEGTVYTEGEFGFQVLLHEFCHVARISWVEGSFRRSADFTSDNDSDLVGECMNSVFSCSLLNYYEWDIAYQVPSNYLRIMLECMDNYEISDYMKHGDTWFFRKLDEHCGYTNYAWVMWQLITLQRSDWLDDQMDIPEEEYLPICDFLCELYYEKYITEDMTMEEARAVADELIEKAYYDAPEGYKTNEERFYENLNKYVG